MSTSELPLFVDSIIVKGFGRGSKQLGCPTANVANVAIDHLTLPTGIYCGFAQLVLEKPDQLQEEDGHQDAYNSMLKSLPFVSLVKPMVCSFGYNPQFGNTHRSLEVHILEKYNFNFYGAELRVLICKKMRDEEKYNSLDELKCAIANDMKRASEQVKEFVHLAQDTRYFSAFSKTLGNQVNDTCCLKL